MKSNKENAKLTDKLSELQKISEWFESSEDLDLEEGLNKAKLAAELIKEAKSRLKKIENEFKVIKDHLSDDEIE